MLSRTLRIATACGVAWLGMSAHAQTLAVLNKSDATVSLLDPATGRTRATLGVGEGPHEAATSPDGRTIVVCNYGQQQPGSTLSVLDIETGQARTIDLEEYHRPHGILFLPDGQRVVVTAEAEQRLLVVNIGAGAVEQAIATDARVSHMVALTPDSRTAFVANIGSGSVSVIDLEKAALVKVVPTGAGAEGVAVHATRPEAWVTNRAADTLSIIDSRSLEVVATLECPDFPIRVAITPDGAHALVSCAQSGDLAVFDVESRTLVRRIPMQAQTVEDRERDQRLFGDQFGQSPVPVGVLIEPDGRRAYVANTNADVVSVIDLIEWRIVDRLRAGREPDGMAWSQKGE